MFCPSGFAIEGPSQAKIEYDDQNDGSCDVKYWPKEPGEYAVHIMCDDEDIKDSPYMAFIHPATGDYNPDLVSALILLPCLPYGRQQWVRSEGRCEPLRIFMMLEK